MTAVGIYVRISQDRGGDGLGVARQEEDCRALCARKGWDVVEVYIDNDTSAYSGAPRTAWERLIGDVEAGTVEAIACWHVDRLTRNPRELEDVIAMADRLGLGLATVTGEIDLSTPTGRMVARILGAAARHESEHKGERQRREHRQRAENGKVAGGGHRPFGYMADRVTVNEPEAVVVRECVARVLAGESLSSVCRDLKERGVQTTAGNHFVPTTLRGLLGSARISGRRQHVPVDSYRGKARPLVGDIVCDAAVWPAIIAPEDSDRLRLLLTRPGRRTNVAAVGRTYLLSGILKCAECGTGMVGRPRSGVPRYVCPNLPGGRSCGGMATNARRTDEEMVKRMIGVLSTSDFADRLKGRPGHDPALVKLIRDDEVELEALAADRSSKAITRAEWLIAREGPSARLERNRDQLARSTRTTALNNFVGTEEEMEARWEAMDGNVSQRRAIVSEALEVITVARANPLKRWDPDRFTLTWLL